MEENNLDFLNEKNWKLESYGYYYRPEKIRFIRIEHSESIEDILKMLKVANINESIGFICRDLSETVKSELKAKKISYIIQNQEIKIFKKEKVKKTWSVFSNYSITDKEISYETPITRVVSPSGLEIVDALFKTNKEAIARISPTDFCRQFNLSRPKLSQMMTSFNVDSLLNLKECLLSLNYSWWIKSFNHPITRRKMTTFQNIKTRRYVMRHSLDLTSLFVSIKSLKEEKIDVELGGISFLKATGVLKTNQLDLMVNEKYLQDIVDALYLRPAAKNEIDNIIYLTFVSHDLKNEKLVGKINNQWDFFQQLDILKLNPLRYLWGLNHEESRIKEAREYLLQVYLNEAKKRNN